MKKSFSILMSLAIAISLTACMGGNTKNNNNTSSENNITPPVNTKLPSEQKISIEDENKEKNKTIVISTLAVTDFYKEAKRKYELKNPNVTIEFNEFETSGPIMNEAEVEKYIKTTTTEILSGKGADLFVLDTIPLPIEKYVSKKAFVDLDQLIKADASFDPNLYQMNIVENSRINGGLYVLPIQFYLQVLFGDSSTIKDAGVAIDDKSWTWNQFAEIGKQLKSADGNKFSLDLMEPESMLNYVVSDNYAQLIDGPTFDSQNFIKMLNEVKSLYDDKIVTAENGESHFRLDEFYSAKDFVGRLALFFEQTNVYEKPHTAELTSGIAFGGINTVAMNSNSTIKATTWDFMKFLMSEEMQSFHQNEGFSINKAVNDASLKQLKTEAKNGTVEVMKAGVVPVTEQSLSQVQMFINNASLPITMWNRVQEIIAEESKPFFTGHKTAEAVAALIQNRITTYINE